MVAGKVDAGGFAGQEKNQVDSSVVAATMESFRHCGMSPRVTAV